MTLSISLRQPRRLVLAGALLAVALLLVSVPLGLRGRAQTPSVRTLGGVPVHEEIAQLWDAADSAVASGRATRSWLWGPQPLAMGVEHAANAGGERQLVYFDKAVLEVNDPDADRDSPWFVTGALLVSQLLSGTVPVTPEASVTLGPAAIPVAGDIEPAGAPTYAALAPLASIAGVSLHGEPVALAAAAVGQPVRALLAADGSVAADGVASPGVTVGAYDAVTGHNIAQPFVDWMNRQDIPGLYVLGRPLTEPYWVETTLGGTPHQVLLQAFERRVLTYTPGNPAGWQVESGNAGLHYRLWRGLSQPADAALVSLASLEPYGEQLVAAASAAGIDPLLLVALAQAASGFDPAASHANGGSGLLALRPALVTAAGGGDPLDPATSARIASAELARRAAAAGGAPDWAAVVAGYVSGDDPALAGEGARLAGATLEAWAALDATHPVSFPADPTPTATAVAPTATATASVPAATPAAGELLGTGQAAYYAQSYDTAWWERTMRLYASNGNAVPGWQYDPNGYYCVRPGYQVGQRLRLEANGVTIDCTIGDTVQAAHVAQWQSRWVIELNWPAFVALGLDRTNRVSVYQLGPRG